MALQYDFDMVAITPEGLPDEFGDLTITGMATEKVAMFRNPETVAAITKADKAVRTFLPKVVLRSSNSTAAHLQAGSRCRTKRHGSV